MSMTILPFRRPEPEPEPTILHTIEPARLASLAMAGLTLEIAIEGDRLVVLSQRAEPSPLWPTMPVGFPEGRP